MKNKRSGKQDLWAKFLVCLSLFVWILVAGILIIIEIARPQFESFFDRFYNLNLRTSWDTDFFYALYYLSIAGLIVSTTGFFLSLFRARRINDSNYISFFIIWLVCITGLAMIKIFFVY